jgi:hypothetical protein
MTTMRDRRAEEAPMEEGPKVTRMSLIAATEFAPDVVGDGRVDCPCGAFHIEYVSGPTTMLAGCPNCGRWLESLPHE